MKIGTSIHKPAPPPLGDMLPPKCIRVNVVKNKLTFILTTWIIFYLMGTVVGATPNITHWDIALRIAEGMLMTCSGLILMFIPESVLESIYE